MEVICNIYYFSFLEENKWDTTSNILYISDEKICNLQRKKFTSDNMKNTTLALNNVLHE